MKRGKTPEKRWRKKLIALVAGAIVLACTVAVIVIRIDGDRDESTGSRAGSSDSFVPHFYRASKSSGQIPVTGRLTAGGQSLRGVVMHFYPVAPANNPISSGVCDSTGNFTMLSGLQGNPGTAPGRYRIVLVQLAQTPEDYAAVLQSRAGLFGASSLAPPGPRPTFHSKYQSVYTSDWEVEIDAKNNTLLLDVEGPER